MESVSIITQYEKETQTVRLVVDDYDNEAIQIMDEMYPNTPRWEGDVHQAELLINLLTKIVKEAK
jgi:hypothetical protein